MIQVLLTILQLKSLGEAVHCDGGTQSKGVMAVNHSYVLCYITLCYVFQLKSQEPSSGEITILNKSHYFPYSVSEKRPT
jgi:hypothetical protein